MCCVLANPLFCWSEPRTRPMARSAIHGLPVVLRRLSVCSLDPDWLRITKRAMRMRQNSGLARVRIHGADQKKRGLWGWDHTQSRNWMLAVNYLTCKGLFLPIRKLYKNSQDTASHYIYNACAKRWNNLAQLQLNTAVNSSGFQLLLSHNGWINLLFSHFLVVASWFAR